jgi:hypothetical protein
VSTWRFLAASASTAQICAARSGIVIP